ncbi:FHA domain-containing protein [Anabaenopsis arnoldii]|uniref:FHA domain-containing protein n=1 Tax=Anabaenopsis arnoldii TaxID=2152938 RepID=A0ABT5ALX0_9CYAN|nr:FHA domain-containing protein [Anabaenopsis arnoldii]MDB9538274.1 FHA domain-containing protein [Anabaenopsis arnoldii]MDH6090539.1 FHA domain-containing protein [Anabaenopsis arnoldii]
MITCAACGHDQNPPNSEFCVVCGSELQTATQAMNDLDRIRQELLKPIPEPFIPTPTPTPTPIPAPIPTPTPQTSPSAIAKLIPKQSGSPVPEFTLDGNAIVGVFDPDMGPVDIDLEAFMGGETVSRNHGEIYQSNGTWLIKDLGSTNGIFIKPVGQTRFGARITTPETLNPGDEIAFGKVRLVFQNL